MSKALHSQLVALSRVFTSNFLAHHNEQEDTTDPSCCQKSSLSELKDIFMFCTLLVMFRGFGIISEDSSLGFLLLFKYTHTEFNHKNYFSGNAKRPQEDINFIKTKQLLDRIGLYQIWKWGENGVVALTPELYKNTFCKSKLLLEAKRTSLSVNLSFSPSLSSATSPSLLSWNNIAQGYSHL